MKTNDDNYRSHHRASRSYPAHPRSNEFIRSVLKARALKTERTLLLCCLILLSAVPACAADNSHPFITRQPIEDAGGQALAGFYQALACTVAQREGNETDSPAITRILHYGDSHVAADILTGALREYFQRDFGDAGPGFILAGRPWPWYRRSGIELSASAGWQSNGLSRFSIDTDDRFGRHQLQHEPRR